MILYKIEGLRELNQALSELSKSTSKAVSIRTLRKVAEPVRAAIDALAPVADEPYYVGSTKQGTRKLVQPGRIKRSIIVGTRLTKRAQRYEKRLGNAKSYAEVYVGPSNTDGALYNATRKEFGNLKTPAEPYMRPGWAATQHPALEGIKGELAEQISKAAARAARRTARLAAKG